MLRLTTEEVGHLTGLRNFARHPDRGQIWITTNLEPYLPPQYFNYTKFSNTYLYVLQDGKEP